MTKKSIERGLDLAAACHQNRLDDIAVDVGERLDQRVLCLLLRRHGPRGLWRGDVGGLLAEAHAGLGRL